MCQRPRGSHQHQSSAMDSPLLTTNLEYRFMVSVTNCSCGRDSLTCSLLFASFRSGFPTYPAAIERPRDGSCPHARPWYERSFAAVVESHSSTGSRLRTFLQRRGHTRRPSIDILMSRVYLPVQSSSDPLQPSSRLTHLFMTFHEPSSAGNDKIPTDYVDGR
jgi:hypothetical protein